MNGVVKIQNQEVAVKEYGGQRVITFKDVDSVHDRPDGTAGRNFRENRERFIEGEDYFKISADEIRRNKIMNISEKNHQDIVLLTESGYLMLVKSFTDDLAWKVQRQLVKSYFAVQQIVSGELSPQLQLLINMEMKQKEHDQKLEELDNKVDSIKEVVALRPNAWRKESSTIINKIAQKVGEEAVETVIEATNGTNERLIYEGSDLIYHLIVLLTSKGYSIEDLERELQVRHSGSWTKH